jgi:ectoine hydroxylase-related dioxygenase (phytanoyl-CoA dioxygenase family)
MIVQINEIVNVEMAVQQIKVNGYVVIEGALSRDKVDRIYEGFQSTLARYIARNGYNRGANRAMMHLPFQAPFADPDLYENPVVLAVLDALFGHQDYACRYFSSDTALPGSQYQQVHSDANPNFPKNSGLTWPMPEIVLNIPLVDVTEENGPLEIWPGGTHHSPVPSLGLSGEKLQQFADAMHHECIYVPAGTIILRDMLMWHRGTPSRSPRMRPNIALIYTQNTHPSEMGIQIPQGQYERLSDRAKRLFRLEKIGMPAVNA